MIPNAIPAGAAAVLLMLPLAASPQLTKESPRVLGADGSPSLQDYLPTDQRYAPGFPLPESVLGWPVGTWHVRHDQLVRWYETVTAASPRASLRVRTHLRGRLFCSACSVSGEH